MTEFTMEAIALRSSLVTAMAFASTDETIPSIEGVDFKARPGAVEVLATDLYVMSREVVKVGGDPFDFTMPSAVAKRLLRLMPRPTRKTPLGMATFTMAEGRVTVSLVGEVDLQMTFTPPNGDYPFPRFQQVVDMHNDLDGAEGPVYFDPAFVARVFRVLSARGAGPVRLVVSTPTVPMRITHGDLDALIASWS